jgi:hypothetical protein
MPSSYEIDVAIRLVRARLWGVVTFPDLKSNRLRMMEDPAFKPDFSQLTDLSDATKIAMTPAEIREFARLLPFTPDSRRAIVAPSDAAFGLARMFGIYREEIVSNDPLRVFRNFKDAEDWLGLSVSRAPE